MAQEVEVKVKVETGQAVEGVNSLEKSFTKLDRSVSASKEKSADYGKQILNNSQLSQKLSQATGGLSDAFVGAVRGIDLTNLSLKGLKTAIASTGVGLLVIALGELITFLADFYSAEKKSEKAVGELTKALDEQSNAFDELTEANKFSMEMSQKHAKANGASKEELKKANDEYLRSEKARNEQMLASLEQTHLATLKDDKLTDDGRKEALEKVNADIEKRKQLRTKLYREGRNADEEFYAQTKEAEKQATEKAEQKRTTDAEKSKQFTIQQRQALAGIEKKFRDDIANMEAKTEEQKLELQKSRALAELDLIKLSEKEKGEARALIIADFKQKEADLEKAHADKIIALNTKLEDDKKTLMAKTDEEKLILSQERAKKQLEQELINDNASETEKKVARDLLQANFDLQDAELKLAKDEKAKEEKIAMIELDLESETLSYEKKKQLILDREALLLQDATLSESKKVKIHKDSVNAQLQLENLKFKAQQDMLKKTSETLSKGAQVLGENTAVGKAMAVASALINTYQGITTELATKTVTPFEIGLKIANVGIIAATGFKAVKNILAVKVPGGGGGGGGGAPSPPSMATPPPAPIEPPTATNPNPNVIASSGINQLATTLGGTPIKAYVVGKDVSTQQSLDRNIVNTATLG
jgi:hypothetical protein